MIDMDSTENEESEAARIKHQQEVLARIIQNELTEKQRQTFLAYHIQKKTVPQIAAEQGVNKSTVSRTLKRTEQKIGRITQYL
jgi:RNA polymerase sigma factor (sigma-70 family)